MKITQPVKFNRQWQAALSDYVTAIAWSAQGHILAASSAAGEVVLYETSTFEATVLQTGNGRSIDCCVFSHDGQFLAVGGQTGAIKIWQIQSGPTSLVATLVATIDNVSAWVDRMAWSPTENLLAFSRGKYVQVWDGISGAIVTTLNFDASSVLALTWHPQGRQLTVGGYQGIKIWMVDAWEDDPDFVPLAAASLAIAWSPDGKYLASGNMDRTVTVWQWGNPAPWMMQGFPGKVQQLAWSNVPTEVGVPLLAAASAEGVVVWQKFANDHDGWGNHILAAHVDNIRSLHFQPDRNLLASAAADGQLILWSAAKRLGQALDGVSQGFSCLAWQGQGQKLAAGGENGELLVWSQVPSSQGFGQAKRQRRASA